MAEAVATETGTKSDSGDRKKVPQLIRKSYEEVRKLADELRKKGLLYVFEDKETGKKTEHYNWTTNHPGSGALSDHDFITNISTRTGDYVGNMIVDGDNRGFSLSFQSVVEPVEQPRNPNYLRKPNYTRTEKFSLRNGEIVYDRHDHSAYAKKQPEKPSDFIKLRDSLFSKQGTNAQAQLVHSRLLDILGKIRSVPPRPKQ